MSPRFSCFGSEMLSTRATDTCWTFLHHWIRVVTFFVATERNCSDCTSFMILDHRFGGGFLTLELPGSLLSSYQLFSGPGSNFPGRPSSVVFL